MQYYVNDTMQGLRQLHGRSEGGRIGVLSLNQEMVNAVP